MTKSHLESLQRKIDRIDHVIHEKNCHHPSCDDLEIKKLKLERLKLKEEREGIH